ncbi:DNA repair protein RadC [Chitinophagaceae bacterium LB-8]|uniref:DNA repair protein RadC n=1 Tax=Paraflavisolibacter caeni TaxID=2982496 RepID=A0A9X3B9C9_9BACT|nr:DNA repair protein RadC [Paraflavisolibacter caeni]MCU7551061.1 DNA repair protein RadC [Paraflavisolibacter caeni]
MQEPKQTIKEWAVDDRPREKVILKGPDSLSDSELLAILITNGIREKSALDLAKDVLKLAKYNLPELGKLNVKELMKVKGIGEAKAITIVAAMELGRRRQASASREKEVITSSSDVARYLQTLYKDYRHEVFSVMYLNRANKVNRIQKISEGGMTGTVADPRIILRKALEEDAVSIILCHNHPSGSLKPSRADEELTMKIKEAARYFDIKVLDHLIVSEDGYFSFADEGIL